MGTAICLQCNNKFTVRIVEDSPDINYFEYDPINCPECDSENTQFLEYNDNED